MNNKQIISENKLNAFPHSIIFHFLAYPKISCKQFEHFKFNTHSLSFHQKSNAVISEIVVCKFMASWHHVNMIITGADSDIPKMPTKKKRRRIFRTQE